MAQKLKTYGSYGPRSATLPLSIKYIINIHLLYLGVEVGMAPLLMRRPVAGILVGLGAVTALVGRRTLVHVVVPYEQCCGSMKF
jgi:hypothetical protein